MDSFTSYKRLGALGGRSDSFYSPWHGGRDIPLAFTEGRFISNDLKVKGKVIGTRWLC